MNSSVEKIIIVSGPSGAGKSTVCSHLLARFPDTLALSVSETTRPKRAGERSGEHYLYVSPEEFQKRVERLHYYEWFYIHGNYYGTPRHTLDDMFQKGAVPLLDIDVNGKKRLARLFPSHVSVFISPVDLEQLRVRLLGRSTDSVDEINRRLENAKKELQDASGFHHILVNDTLDQTLSQAEKIVEQYIYG